MNRVRPATSSDVDPVARLRALRRAEGARSWAERCVDGDPDRRLFVAEVDEAVVGYGLATRFVPPDGAPPEAAPAGFYLTGVVVAPSHRRRGLGAELTAARLAWIFERAERAFYFADDDNLASVMLHTRFGFTPVTRSFWFPGLEDPTSAMTLYAVTRS